VHYWADLQSLHGFRCYDNSAEREMPASACSRSVPACLTLGLGIHCSMKFLAECLAEPKLTVILRFVIVIAKCPTYRPTHLKRVDVAKYLTPS